MAIFHGETLELGRQTRKSWITRYFCANDWQWIKLIRKVGKCANKDVYAVYWCYSLVENPFNLFFPTIFDLNTNFFLLSLEWRLNSRFNIVYNYSFCSGWYQTELIKYRDYISIVFRVRLWSHLYGENPLNRLVVKVKHSSRSKYV